MYARISVALQQSNAQAIFDFRHAEIDVPAAGQQDAVMDVLNTKLISLADCDADLRSVQGVEMALQGALSMELMSWQRFRLKLGLISWRR